MFSDLQQRDGMRDQRFCFMTGAASASVSSPRPTISDANIQGINATAGYRLESDGDIVHTDTSGQTDVGDWLSRKSAAPGAWEVRATLSSGSAPVSGTLNTWQALTSNREWTNSAATVTSVLLIEIRLASGAVRASATVTIECQLVGP
jgi:hypothetical protein